MKNIFRPNLEQKYKLSFGEQQQERISNSILELKQLQSQSEDQNVMTSSS
jgi:hypothetical protein